VGLRGGVQGVGFEGLWGWGSRGGVQGLACVVLRCGGFEGGCLGDEDSSSYCCFINPPAIEGQTSATHSNPNPRTQEPKKATHGLKRLQRKRGHDLRRARQHSQQRRHQLDAEGSRVEGVEQLRGWGCGEGCWLWKRGFWGTVLIMSTANG